MRLQMYLSRKNYLVLSRKAQRAEAAGVVSAGGKCKQARVGAGGACSPVMSMSCLELAGSFQGRDGRRKLLSKLCRGRTRTILCQAQLAIANVAVESFEVGLRSLEGTISTTTRSAQWLASQPLWR